MAVIADLKKPVSSEPVSQAQSPSENGGLYRAVPQNLEAEQGLLGALLIDNRSLEKIGDFLKPLHFYAPAHQRIYQAIQILVDRGQTASPVTLKS